MKKMTVNAQRLMIALTVMLLTAAKAGAMSYEQARNEALFLTDKMAYELNLTEEQYEAAYEINLDYLMGVTSYDDVYGPYWERRNLDLSYVLFDWQWNAFRAATYFYRPLYWNDGFWHFAVYARYPHRDYFYFGRPVFYASYRGGHAWHVVGGHGYYYGRRDHYRPAPVAGRSHFGMLDRWNRGDYGNGRAISPRPNNHRMDGQRPTGSYGGYRSSSTRTTATQHSHAGGSTYSHSHAGSGSAYNNSHGQAGSGHSFGGSRSSSSSHSSGNFSGSHSSSHSSGSCSGGHSSSGSGRSFGGRR